VPDTVFRVVLPLFWLCAIAGVVANRWRVQRQLGHDPVVVRPWQRTESVAGYLERTLGICVLMVTVDIALNAVLPRTIGDTLAIQAIRTSESIGAVGLGLLTAGAVQAAIGVRQMGESWRVGIDRRGAGPLVLRGLFSRVRHPVYGGMLLTATGLAAVTADLLAISVAATAWVALPVQARLEEAFLLSRHPLAYPAYARKTGRFWPKTHRRR
jgi:protein-S-isoprenylcysteine O-methyltransferase Ste14